MDHNIYLLMSHRYLQGLLVLLDIQKIKNNSVCYLSIMTYWLVMLGLFIVCHVCTEIYSVKYYHSCLWLEEQLFSLALYFTV